MADTDPPFLAGHRGDFDGFRRHVLAFHDALTVQLRAFAAGTARMASLVDQERYLGPASDHALLAQLQTPPAYPGREDIAAAPDFETLTERLGQTVLAKNLHVDRNETYRAQALCIFAERKRIVLEVPRELRTPDQTGLVDSGSRLERAMEATEHHGGILVRDMQGESHPSETMIWPFYQARIDRHATQLEALFAAMRSEERYVGQRRLWQRIRDQGGDAWQHLDQALRFTAHEASSREYEALWRAQIPAMRAAASDGESNRFYLSMIAQQEEFIARQAAMQERLDRATAEEAGSSLAARQEWARACKQLGRTLDAEPGRKK